MLQTAVHAVLCASEKIHVVCSERAAGISVQLVALTKCQNWSHSGSERRVTRTTHRNPTFRRHEPTTDLFFITLTPVITLSPVSSIQPTPWSTDPHRLRSISYPPPRDVVTEDLYPCSEQSTTCPIPEQDESCKHFHTLFLKDPLQ